MPPFAFLALPPEIRIQTYRHYFRDSRAFLSLPCEATFPTGKRELRILAGPEGALFLTCRLIFRESRLVFFDRAVYCFDPHSQLCQSPIFIRERHYARIKRFVGTRAECEALTDAVLGFGRSGELTSLVHCQVTDPWELGCRDDDDNGFIVLLRKLAMCKAGLKVSLRIDYMYADVHELLGAIAIDSDQVSSLLRVRSQVLGGKEDGFADRDALMRVDQKHYEKISHWKAQHLPKVALPLTHVNQQTISTFNKLVASMFKDIFGLLRLKVRPDMTYIGQRKPVVCEHATWWDEGYDSVHEAEEEWRRKKEEEEKLNKRNDHRWNGKIP